MIRTMIAVVQRVTEARVTVGGEIIGLRSRSRGRRITLRMAPDWKQVSEPTDAALPTGGDRNIRAGRP